MNTAALLITSVDDIFGNLGSHRNIQCSEYLFAYNLTFMNVPAVLCPALSISSRRSCSMKSLKFGALALAAAVILSMGAFAKDKNEGKFTLTNPAQIGSTQLKPGDYKAVWEGTGSDVQVKILQGKDVVATTSAKLVDKQNTSDSVTLGGADNVKTVDEIDFARAKKALVFGSAQTAQR
jgi:hypothetical protein